jgi:hypothetical protein
VASWEELQVMLEVIPAEDEEFIAAFALKTPRRLE